MSPLVLGELHSGISGGHFGVAKTSEKVKIKYYWHGQSTDVRIWCEKCIVCGARKMPPKTIKAPLQQSAVSAPMERLAIDIVGPLPETKNGNKFMVVIIDYFTKWAEASGLLNQKAALVADKLIEQVVCRFGVPH